MNNATDIGISFKNSISGEKKLERYAETLTKINGALSGITKGKAKEVEQVANNIKQVDKVKESSKDIKGGLLDLASITALVHSFKTLTKTFSQMVSQSANYLENMNLLDVAFNNDTNEAKKFVNTLTEMYGLDESWGYKTIGLFKQLSNAMGLADETGTTLAKTLTALSIDLASLYNVNTQSAVEKLTSALAGQTKPVRVFGADITEATLQMTLMENGIDKLVSNLSFAEKRLLIVTSILNQTKEAQNDWARTIESLANQMRIMDEQMSRLTRAMGNVFMPLLKTIIPYLNAFLMVITEIINWLATLVGYNEKEFDFFGGTNESVEQLTQNLNQAGSSANKLKSGLRSFDKLNNITTPSASSSGGGLGVDEDILNLFNKTSKNYLKNMMNVEMLATKIRDKIMAWLGFTKLTNDETKDVSFVFDHITSGTVLGALGVGGVIYSGINFIMGILSKIGLIKFSNISGLFSAIKGIKLTSIIGNITKLGGSITKFITSPIGIVIGLLVLLTTTFIELYKENEEFRKKVDELVATIKESLKPIIEKLKSLFESLMTLLGSLWKNVILPIIDTLQESLKPVLEILIDVLSWLWKNVLDPLINIALDGLYLAFEGLSWLLENVIGPAIKVLGDIFLALWDNALKPLVDFIKNTFTPIFDGIAKMIEKIKTAIEKLVEKWNNSKFNKKKLEVEVGEKSDGSGNKGGGFLGNSKFSIGGGSGGGAFASGGMPNVGQMFIANERGPELVGHIGGQSFVANQSQMMDLLDKKLGNANSGVKNATFVINVGSEEIGRVVLNNLQDIAKDNGKPIVIGG